MLLVTGLVALAGCGDDDGPTASKSSPRDDAAMEQQEDAAMKKGDAAISAGKGATIVLNESQFGVRTESTTPDQIEIEVADTGDGIEPAERSQVFDAFFQGANRAARTDGSAGLGLAISRAIIEAHGGRIWLEDAPRGNRVRFSLPAATTR